MQINEGLMTISDFLQKYKIVMYPNFWPIINFFTLPLFYIWAPSPEERSAGPCLLSGTQFHQLRCSH